MGKENMGRQWSLRSKAVHFVSGLTTVLLNPISDYPNSKSLVCHPHSHPVSEDKAAESDLSQEESISEEGSQGLGDGPDTSSFTAFLYSLLSPSAAAAREEPNMEENDGHEAEHENEPNAGTEGGGPGRRSPFSGGKQSIGKAVYYAARFGGYRNQVSEEKDSTENDNGGENNGDIDRGEGFRTMEGEHEDVLLVDIPEMSEDSRLLSDKSRRALYVSLPSLAKGRKWVLLYSTWRHGISLSTLYRRSQLCPGLSLLVVGDRNGATFGALAETPLIPSKSRKYQGTNNTFVFTDLPGHPVVFRPTGANRYFTLCSADFLAFGGGGHFALYLDTDLLNGSSFASDTYGNPCLAHSQDFEVKEIELWGFVYASKYEEVLALSHAQAPGISRW
ncbi:hypothetical protein Dimus_017908 [Dionaea muscipula]